MKVFLASFVLLMVLVLSAGHSFIPMTMDDMVMKTTTTVENLVVVFSHCFTENCLEMSSGGMPHNSCLEHCLAASKNHALPESLPVTPQATGAILLLVLAMFFFALVKQETRRFLYRFTIFKEQLPLQQLATIVLRN